MQDAIGTPDEQRETEQVYKKLTSVNFSKRVLENLSYEDRQNFQVLPVRGVTWKDWGTSDRLSKTLRQLGAPDLVTPEPVVSEGRAVRVSSQGNLAALRTIR
jgi:hypothetical protein